MVGFSRAAISSALLQVLLFTSSSEAKDIIIGGKPNSWKIPNSEVYSLNHWAARSHFLIGDSLVWEYDGSIEKDPVLQVTRKDYVTSNTSSPIYTHKGNNIKVKLDKSGPYYFINGEQGHCEKGGSEVVYLPKSFKIYY